MITTSSQAGDATLHQRVDDLIAAAGLDDVASLAEVLTAVSRHRGRRLELEPMPADLQAGEVFGLCLPYPDRDVVLFRTGAGPEHELHSTLHECGHLLLGHVAAAGTPAPARDSVPTGDSAPAGGVLPRLLPDLDPELVAGALARSNYEDTQEREAELFAMKVRQTITAASRRRGDAILRRFDDALG